MLNRIRTTLICAIDSNSGISKNSTIPWKIKEDTNFFQDVTKREYVINKKNATIMGKTTWKVLPDTYRGLKDRVTIVVSSSMTKDELDMDNVTGSDSYVAKSLDEAYELCYNLDVGKIFICGGSGIYNEVLNNKTIDEIYLTQINKDYNCDNKIEKLLSYIKNNNYKEYLSKYFMVNDLNSNTNVGIMFTKYYKNQLPQHLTYNINNGEKQYLDLLEQILRDGNFRQTRNSKTWSVFGKHLEFNLNEGFPILTTKKVFFRGIVEELLFFLKGDTNAKHLSDKGVKIWDLNTSTEFLEKIDLYYDEGDMGPMYGFQWRFFGAEYNGMNNDYTNQGVNQLEYCLNLLKTDPFNRRNLMTTLNISQVKEGVLWPCHSIVIQWYVELDYADNYQLSMSCYNRSQDFLLGNPFNLTMSSLLIHLFCEVINNDPSYSGPKFTPGRLIMNLGDVHIYENHYSEVIRQILREPYKFPQLIFKRKVSDLTDFTFDDMELTDYNCYPNFPVKMIA